MAIPHLSGDLPRATLIEKHVQTQGESVRRAARAEAAALDAAGAALGSFGLAAFAS
jgi:hypothetical protein